MLKAQKLGETGYFFCVNEQGLIQLHQNDSYILKKNVNDFNKIAGRSSYRHH